MGDTVKQKSTKISVSKKSDEVKRHQNKILTNFKAHGNLGVMSRTHRHKLASYPAKECKKKLVRYEPYENEKQK